jgi:RNA polymerase sigma-70 factor (ECF subfamily)
MWSGPGPKRPGPFAMPTDDATDLDALMARLADGDRLVFTPVFQILWPRVIKLCSSMLKNDADASDAAQQAMEKILSRASGYDRGRAALPWALAIGAWECRTIRRSRLRRREFHQDGGPEPATSSSEDDLVQRNLTAAALDAIGQLSEADKETLFATFWEESSGAAKGPALRKRRERALHRLREAFRRIYGID